MLKREEFKLLKNKIGRNEIVYFDNSATTQKPNCVVNAIVNFYNRNNSNVHRGINPLADAATREYEDARKKVGVFLNARSEREIVFTSGATDGLNLIANVLGDNVLKKGDVVLLTEAEHHANIVPWMMLEKKVGIKIKYIPITEDFRLDMDAAESLLRGRKVKVLSVQHVSNVLGIVNDVNALVRIAREKKVISVIDAAGSAAHRKIDVVKIGCDFLVFSGHKVFGPTGIGVVYGREEILCGMKAWKGGGDMIREVSRDGFVESEVPFRFEAGTPNIAGAVGLGVALDFVLGVGWKSIMKHESDLCKYFIRQMRSVKYIKLIGPVSWKDRVVVFSMVVDGVHPHDVAEVLGGFGIIARAGHHCVQPLHDQLGLNATLRVSLSIYNNEDEIDVLMVALDKVYEKFK